MAAGRVFAQANAANQPSFAYSHGPNSKPAFVFPGTTSRFLDYTGDPADFTHCHSTVSTFCVAFQEPEDNTGTYAGVHTLYNTQPTTVATSLGANERLGNTHGADGANLVWNMGTASWTAPLYRWRAFRRSVYPTVSGCNVRGSSPLNGTINYTAAPSASPATAMRLFCDQSAGRPMSRNVAIYEMIWFDYTLSVPEIAIVSAYFVDRYGVDP